MGDNTQYKAWDFINENTLVIPDGDGFSFLHYFRGHYLQASMTPNGIGCVYTDSRYAWFDIKELLSNIHHSYDYLTDYSKNVITNIILAQVLSVIRYCDMDGCKFIVDKLNNNITCREVINLLKLIKSVFEEEGIIIDEVPFSGLIKFEYQDSDNLSDRIVDKFEPSFLDNCLDYLDVNIYFSADDLKPCRYHEGVCRGKYNKLYMACSSNEDETGIFLETYKLRLNNGGVIISSDNGGGLYKNLESEVDKSVYYNMTEVVDKFVKDVYSSDYEEGFITRVVGDLPPEVLCLFNMCIQQIRVDFNIKKDFTHNYDNFEKIRRDNEFRAKMKETMKKFTK